MKRKTVPRIMLTLLSISIFNIAFQIGPAIAESVGSYVSVPYHYQTKYYYCGPASLEMVFDFYGPDISQLEIADVARTSGGAGTFTDDMRRAAHFSNLSTSVGNEMFGSITGYWNRKLGYAAFEHWLTLEELKSLIDAGHPIIVLTWLTEARMYGHFRVVVGYNETHMTLMDPWFGWNLNMTHSEFHDFWQYSGGWGLFISPWNVHVFTPETVQEGNTFVVTANVTYPCPSPFSAYARYPASLSEATINLPVGLSLDSAETPTKTINMGNLAAGSSAVVNWTVRAESSGTSTVSVKAEGKITGSVTGYSYEDRIGGVAKHSVTIIPAEAVSIDLIRRMTWPEHHHFGLSKDGNPTIDDRHDTPGYQTLYCMVKNTGNTTIPAGTYEVVWNISDPTSSTQTLKTVGPIDLPPGKITVLAYDVSAVDLTQGKYYVKTRCRYCYDAMEGEEIKTFSFTVAS